MADLTETSSPERQQQQQRPAKPMRLLALGLPRCGTDSLRKALLLLGFDGVYHGWIPPLESHEDYNVWQDLAASQWNFTGSEAKPLNREAFERVLGNYEATTDQPGTAFAYELMKAYPEAKVMLNTREFTSWQTSFRATIAPLQRSWEHYILAWLHPGWRQEWNFYQRQLVHFWQGDFTYNTERRYYEHHALVRGLAAQQGRELLEWRVQDGWEPLCRFLDLPVPDVPFPSGNTANDYEERIEQKMQGIRADCVRWAGYAGVAAAVVLGAAFQAARRWHRV